MSHSTSLRAAGSEMAAAAVVALLAPSLRKVSIAFLTRAISASEVSGGSPGASGICGTAVFSELDLLSLDLLSLDLLSLDLLSLDLLSLELLSLDLPVANFFPVAFAVLSADLDVAAGEPLPPPRFAAASAASVTASRLAQASAATTVRYRRVKSA